MTDIELNVEEEARKLLDITLEGIQNARANLAKQMSDAGMTKETYGIADNLEALCNGDVSEYSCWAVLRTPFTTTIDN